MDPRNGATPRGGSGAIRGDGRGLAAALLEMGNREVTADRLAYASPLKISIENSPVSTW